MMSGPRSLSRDRGRRFVLTTTLRLLVFAILAVALHGKIQNATAILIGDSLLSSWLLLKTVIAFEVFAATCILVATRSTVWCMVVALFSVFSAFATFELMDSGGCSCFGRSLPNWLSLPVDLLILGAMVGSRNFWREDSATPCNNKASHGAKVVGNICRRDAIAIVTGAGSALLVVVLFLPSPETARGKESPADLRFLLAQDWIGEVWPVGQEMNVGLLSLNEGEWLVLVLRRDCMHCRDLAEELITAKADGARYDVRVATFVAGTDSWIAHLGNVSMKSTGPIRVKWPRGAEPFVASPAAFFLHDGMVHDARDGKECREFALKTLGITGNVGRQPGESEPPSETAAEVTPGFD